MESVYYEASNPGSYGGVRPLITYSGAPAQNVKTWLTSQDAYTLHRPVRRIFKRRNTSSKGINDVFQADLAEMQKLASFNDNYRFFLSCICVFSKYGFVIPPKNKRGSTIVEAFEKIFWERTSTLLQTDRSTEFLNNEVQDLFKKYSIRHY